jgi:hypothetical protein
MATYNFGFDKTFIADVDLSNYQYYLMTGASTAGKIARASAAGGSVIGVLQNDPVAGEAAVVRVLGFSKVIAHTEAAASPLTALGWVKSGSHGMAVGFVSATASTWAAGYTTETYASGASGFVEMFVLPQRIV